MLREHGIEHDYREYSKDPLSLSELRELFGKLGVSPRELLRKRDKAFGELGLSGDEDDETLLGHMAEHPTLLQRPIGVLGDRAVVGRPHTDLLTLLD
ncbi:MAG: ArsC/Spx/MgsR family protein [Myxococcota bacterium]|nr:ArsC/Spx/MgsR family protein [Myxococcota bacterium]